MTKQVIEVRINAIRQFVIDDEDFDITSDTNFWYDENTHKIYVANPEDKSGRELKTENHYEGWFKDWDWLEGHGLKGEE
jgi:hypothetical protein